MSSNQNPYSITQWVLGKHELRHRVHGGRSQRAGRRRACPWERAGRAQLLTVPTGATSLWGKQRQKPPPRAALAQAGLPLNFLENRNSSWRSVTHPDDNGCKLRDCNGDPAPLSPLREKGQQGLLAYLPGAGPSTGMTLFHPHNQEG